MKHFKKQSNHHKETHNENIKVNIGDHLPLSIKKLGVNGQGIGYFKHKVCFVPGALPGEEVVATVTKVHERFLEGKIHRLRKVSPNRVEPRDSYADKAGGFEFESLTYPAQLKFKHQVIRDALAKFKPRGWQNYEIRSTLGSEDQYHYRNKAQFQVRKVDDHVAAGLFQRDSHQLVPITSCAVQYPQTMKVMNAVVAMINDLQIPVFNPRNNSGIIKTIVIRESHSTGEIQLTFITNTPKLIHRRQLLSRINNELPEVTSVMQNVNPGDTPLIWGDQTIHLAGKTYITESLMGLDFHLSARSFLQLNPAQTDVLYEQAAKALDLSPNDTLIDAYAGIGTIGLSLAPQVKRVLGMETIAEAVADANHNAQLNGIKNATYECGSAEELLPKWQSDGISFDALVVDPPRTGLDPKLMNAIIKAKPAKFAYVSCNMASMARNLRTLSRVYRVDYIQPVDMMPQTPRCEAVVKLILR